MLNSSAVPANALSPTARYPLIFHRLAASGQWERALDEARAWVAAKPEDGMACRAAAQALINLRINPGEAVTLLGTTLRSNPKDDFALRLISIAYSRLGQPKQARAAIDEAIALAPSNVHHHEHLAWLCYRAGSLGEARRIAELAHCQRSRGLDPLSLM